MATSPAQNPIVVEGAERPVVHYDRQPDRYVHWKLTVEGAVATGEAGALVEFFRSAT